MEEKVNRQVLAARWWNRQMIIDETNCQPDIRFSDVSRLRRDVYSQVFSLVYVKIDRKQLTLHQSDV
jgi:hypothetical protein